MQYSIPILAQMPRNRLSILFTLQFLADDQNRTNLKNVSFFFFKKERTGSVLLSSFKLFFMVSMKFLVKTRRNSIKFMLSFFLHLV